MTNKINPKILLVMSLFIAAILPIPVFSDMHTEEPPLIQFTYAHLTKGIISEIEYDILGSLLGAKIYLGFENMGGSGTITISFNTIFGPDRSETYEIENAGRYDLYIHVGLSYSAFRDDELEVSSPNQIGNPMKYIFEDAQINYIKKILLIPILPPPEVYYVDHRANGSGNGLNWENALQHVQTALQLAKFYEGSVHEIRVAQGTYQPDTLWSFGLVRKATFKLIDDIEVKGGYAGVGQTDPDARDIELYATVLSGDRWGDDVDVSDPCDLPAEPTRDDNSYHVVTGSGTDANAVLDGFTITGGNAKYSYPSNFGGGLVVDGNSSPTLIDCTFTGNSANFGGGMGNYNSRPTLTNCTFSSNFANYGGGMANYANANPSVINCKFEDNSAKYGGGMRNSDSSPTLTHCTFSNNSAEYGGGMSNYSSSPRLTNCIFSGNSVDDFGGGIFNQANSSLTLTNCTFSSNWANYGGGGMANDSNTNPTVIDCTFSDNLAGQGGGGMANYSYSSPTVTDCTFSDNLAGQGGGGMANYSDSSPTVTDCTFSNNSASYGGGMNSYLSNPTLTNCIFSGNSVDDYGGAMLNEASNPTVTGCLFSSNSADYGGGVLNLSSSPILNNCTFAANSAESYGGGIYEFDNNPTVIGCAFSDNVAGIGGGGTTIEDSTATLVNCTFSGNAAANGNALACESEPQAPSNVELTNCILWDGGDEIRNFDGSTITVSYSDVQGGYVGTGNLDSDPCFVQSGCWVNANDPNIIVEPNDPNAMWVDGNYRLRPDSPCIDAGYNYGVPADYVDLDNDGNTSEKIPWDLDGFERFIDDICTTDTGSGTPPIVDMGAHEFLRSDIDSTGYVNLADFSVIGAYWQTANCGTCEGADLTCDGNVDNGDLAQFVTYWLAGVEP